MLAGSISHFQSGAIYIDFVVVIEYGILFSKDYVFCNYTRQLQELVLRAEMNIQRKLAYLNLKSKFLA